IRPISACEIEPSEDGRQARNGEPLLASLRVGIKPEKREEVHERRGNRESKSFALWGKRD
ncbi:MAG TPA: hypothetical protein VFS35_11000, partial [Terrimicrobiaceae bacterium]|nr:hypothetical protein [Terrimicrobiaceae bacterium]